MTGRVVSDWICGFLFLQVWPTNNTGGLCGMFDAIFTNRGWDETSSAIWKGQKTCGGSEWRRSLHDAIQSYWKTESTHVDHDLYGQLQWQCTDVNSGKNSEGLRRNLYSAHIDYHLKEINNCICQELQLGNLISEKSWKCHLKES